MRQPGYMQENISSVVAAHVLRHLLLSGTRICAHMTVSQHQDLMWHILHMFNPPYIV